MEFVMNMVHHNPGDKPFESKFLDPAVVKNYGGNAQVFKHINTAVDFREYDETLFAGREEGLEWIGSLADQISAEINAAKKCGLQVFYHIDLFLFPKAVMDKYHEEICDEKGRISMDRPKTLELHRAMLDEIFKRFSIDGLIIRVGETYLYDTPYHMGNGAVEYREKETEQAQFIKLIDFLRSEVCEKHDKYLFFRTWDCFPDRFHADLNYYLDVTNRIQPHPKLLFSIKHTALDFWRRVKFNECLGKGRHRQIVEVQCQREYEGKGAYPMYVMNGVINSFADNKEPKGLRDLADNPLISGLYIWPRGGGWHGPYPKDEFWCDLNTYVISKYGENPARSEEEIFSAYAKEQMGLKPQDMKIWRKLCLTANEAILKGRYIECYDRILNEEKMPCANWMRDDHIGGLNQLGGIIEYLFKKDLLWDAVREKWEACLLWKEVSRLYGQISVPDLELSEFIKTSIEYGCLLFEVVYRGWEVMAHGYEISHTEKRETADLKTAIENYDRAWESYKKLEGNPYASTLYRDEFLSEPGIGQTVNEFRSMLKM